MIDFGIWQGRLSTAIQLPERSEAAVRRKPTFDEHETLGNFGEADSDLDKVQSA